LASILAWLFSLLPPPQVVQAAVPAGYSEYYIPGGSDQLWAIFEDLDNDPDLVEDQGLHAVIAVTASTDNTTIYYDHWEDGYDFVLNDPTTADEQYVLNQGEVQPFETSNIPIPRGDGTMTDCGGSACHDGRDRIYVAGGPVTVTRASWPESIGTVFALAWEVYPTKPFLTSYTVPIGENLADLPTSYDDFDRVYVIVQAIEPGTTVQIDDPTTPGIDIDTPLAQGGVTRLDSVNTGTTVLASAPVQVQFIVGQAHDGEPSEIRGYSAFPDTLWDTQYYNPVGSFGGGENTDLYLYNPSSAPITIDYEDSLGTGSFAIPANSTVSYSGGTGRFVPPDSGVYLRSDGVFWGVGSGDTESYNYDWGYSLVPAYALTDEYFLGWAPGTRDLSANGSPVFVTPVQDDTTVYVDYGPTDGVADATYTLNRLESQKIFDPDRDNTGMHIWATGPLAVAWGEDPDASVITDPYLDLGYTTLPLREEWMDVVLGIEKSVNPPSLPAEGGTVTFRLVVTAGNGTVYHVDISDVLPVGWEYVDGSTSIVLSYGPGGSGPLYDPTAISGYALTWDLDGLGLNDTMPANSTIALIYQAQTISGAYSAGLHDNLGQAYGEDGNGAIFRPEDHAFVFIPNLPYLNLNKTSSPEGVVEVGDGITYTICFSNSGLIAATGVVITDLIPANTIYVTGSVTGPAPPIGTPPPLPDPAIEYRTDTGDWVSPEPLTVTGLRWNIGQLVTGTTHCVSFQVQVTTQAQDITNVAFIDSNETDPLDDPAFNTFSDGEAPEPEPPEAGPPATSVPPTPVPPTPTPEVLPVERLPETGGFPDWFPVVLGVPIIIGAAGLLNLARLEMRGRRGDGKGD
jgi:uncharacterized repeat protein (TIGR01451 family)